MLRPRIIPCLLIQNKGLVKTINFKNGKYVGDPINAVRIFNEKKVDELMVLDIDASANNIEPNYVLLEKLAAECRMPLCYGGGITTSEQAERIFGLGIEKISLSHSALVNPSLISEISSKVGNQSVVVVLDVKKKRFGGYDIFSLNGTFKHDIDLFKYVSQLDDLGAGELVINSIDNDGVMKGYNLELANKIREKTKLPLTILGGAGKLEDLGELINKLKIVGCAAGSLFVFKGKYRAVLINYPSEKEKLELIKQSF